MKKVWTGLGALAVGAAVMALSDPEMGARRRAYLRRRIAMAAQDAMDGMESAGRQADDRLQSVAYESRGVLGQASDRLQDAAQQGRSALDYAVERLQDAAQEGRGAVGQAVERLQGAATHGQDAGLRLLHRIQELAREGRSRLSDRFSDRLPDRETLERWRPGIGLSLLTAVSGIVVGAAAMFLLDPQQGRRRLALARDQARHLGRSASGFAEVGLRDLSHRARGLAAQASGRLRRDQADDVVLVQRVRAALGRVVSHPHAIWVTAAEGCVTVGGPVLADERSPLLKCVGSVHGVREVRDALEPHESASHVPALQGGRSRNGANAEYLQAHWAPGPRLLALAGGAALALYGASRRSLPGLLAGVAGTGLVLRAARNEGLGQTVARVAHRQQQQDAGATPPALEAESTAGAMAEPAQPRHWPSAATPTTEQRGAGPLH